MKSILFCFLVAAKFAIAALPGTGVFNVKPTGTVGGVNGAMFNPARGGTDYSLQDSAQLHLTDFTTSGAGSTTLATATGGFTPNMVGNGIHLVSGTNFTAGWYEITTYTDGTHVVLDRTPTAGGAGSLGNGYIGGAFNIGTVGMDDNFFEAVSAGTTCYIKSGTYTPAEVIGVATTSPAFNPARIIGYTAVQGDDCDGTARPKFLLAANSILLTSWVKNMQFETTAALGVQIRGVIENVRVINQSTSADRIGFNTSSSTMLIDCEGVSYRGIAANLSGSDSTAYHSVFHSSKNGLQVGVGSNSGAVIECVLHSSVTNQLLIGAAQTARYTIQGNTIFGGFSPNATGMNLITGSTGITFVKNIIYGCSTGVINVDVQTTNYDDYNNYFNNTADVSSAAVWQKGPHDTAINPVFTGVGQLTGATATTTAGNHLVQSGADFSSVVPGRDFLVIISGSGPAVGGYGILTVDSATQITTDVTLTANATADKVWRITNGHNFNVGYDMKGLAGHIFKNGDINSRTRDYADQGAAQRFELSSDGVGGDSVFSK